MKKKVIISVTNDLSNDNRVYKVASSLLNIGFDVTCVGRKLKESKELNFLYRTKRFKLLFNNGFMFYAEYNLRLLFFLLTNKFDIFLANDLDTLAPNYIAAKLKNKPVVYDSHEYFTEVPELTNRNFTKKFWTKIEQVFLPKIKYSYTVCSSIADVYNGLYNINMQVVRNIPLCNSLKQNKVDVVPIAKNNIILYQGAVNIGRGLEHIIKAMKYIKNSTLIIIGDGDIKNDLEELVVTENVSEKVIFTGRIAINELQNYTKQATIGISIEENIGLNYYYALPNKIFDYIKAEIPILASNLPEIKRIVSHYNVGEFIDNHSPKHIVEIINLMLNDKEKLKKYSENCSHAAKELCWEKEYEKIEEIFKGIIV